MHRYEAGGIAFHSQATTMAVIASNGRHITLDDILPNLILEPDIHFCPTRLICLENTLQGMVFPQEEIIRISDFAKEKGIAMHCDGARMWEVQAKTGKSLKELCAPFETVSLCMSKGLGAPIGSLLVGPKAFIEKAKWFRKLLGVRRNIWLLSFARRHSWLILICTLLFRAAGGKAEGWRWLPTLRWSAPCPYYLGFMLLQLILPLRWSSWVSRFSSRQKRTWSGSIRQHSVSALPS